MSKEAYGLLIDYEYCSGCQSCEVTCKETHNYPVGKWGIRVLEEGPWEIEDGTGVFDYNLRASLPGKRHHLWSHRGACREDVREEQAGAVVPAVQAACRQGQVRAHEEE